MFLNIPEKLQWHRYSDNFPLFYLLQKMCLSAGSLLLQWVAVLKSAADAVQSLVPYQTWNYIKEIALQILQF